MKLQYDSYPDFYKPRKFIVREDTEIFVGRKVQLESFWDELFNLTSNSSSNCGIIGQRKMGKTASLTRFYNVAFWEQDEIIPFYYCFSNQTKTIIEITNNIVLTFIKQGMAFLFKDSKFMDVKKLNDLNAVIKNVKNKKIAQKLSIIFDDYTGLRNEAIERGSENFLLEIAFLTVINFVDHFEMNSMCIIDEMQEMATGVITNSKGEPINDPWSLERVAEDPGIWTIVSGSKVSMLYHQIIRKDVANRIKAVDFFPLSKSDTFQLIRKIIKRNRHKNVYKDIEKDVYEVCGGYPFYIISLFKNHWEYTELNEKKKSFRSKKEFMEVFLFEVSHKKGIIYQFWAEHFAQNAEKLNCAPPNRPGLTYEILCYLMDHDEVSYDDLMKTFNLTNEEARFRRQQLIDADLFYSINDRMLRLILPQIQHLKFDKASTKGEIAPEMLQLVNEKLNIIHK